MILVTGATGKVGSAAVRHLASHGMPVRALVRDAERFAELGVAAAEVAVGAFDDSGALDRAMGEVRALVLVSPGNPDEERNVIAAAVRADVQHVVYLTSKASLDAPIERRRWHAQVEQSLAASGLPHTLLRSNAFMQNTLALAPVIRANGGFASAAGDGRMGLVDTRDVGEVAARVAAGAAEHVGKTYRLSGPASVSYADVAAILSELLDQSVTFTTISADEERERMIAAGVPAPVAAMNAQAFSLNATGDADWVTDDVSQITERPARSFDTFASDHLAAFRG